MRFASTSAILVAVFCFGCAGAKQSQKSMDVSLVDLDDNLFNRNPRWVQKVRTGNAPNPCSFCPCGSSDPDEWTAAPDCTTFPVHFDGGGTCSHGHMNWFPVTYEGALDWRDYSGGLFSDQDYNFAVRREDEALYQAGKSDLQLEFDSRETVDQWRSTNTWWDQFHDKVDEGQDAAHAALENGPYVIVTGLLGLDTQHDAWPELHPVYAMFVHVKDDPMDDRWAFFVRNWGNEGGCSDGQEALDTQGVFSDHILRFRLPHEGAKPTLLIPETKLWRVGPEKSVRNLLRFEWDELEGAILLTFTLAAPSEETTWMGDLVLRWENIDGTPAQPRHDGRPRGAQPLRVERDVSDLDMRVAQLDAASQKELRERLSTLAPARIARAELITIEANRNSSRAKVRAHRANNRRLVRREPDAAAEARRLRERAIIEEYLRAKGLQ